MSSLKPTASIGTAAPFATGRTARAIWLFTLCLVPTLVFLLAFTYWPLVTSVWNSLQLWDLDHPIPHWTGLSNYSQQFADANFRQVLGNTAIYVIIAAPLSILLGLVFALAVNGRSKLRVAARALIFHPVLLPTVAIAAIWLFLLDPVSGPLPALISSVLRTTPSFLSEPRTALVTVALVGVYKNTGLYMLFFLAGLQGIPRDIVAAARIDGAGPWRMFRYVTWPLLGPVSFYVAVTATLDSLRNVDHIFVLTQGGPANGTNVILYQIYLEGFQYWNAGQASALTVLFVALLLLIGVLVLPRLERGIYYEA